MRAILRRLRGDDEGYALLAVLGIGMVLIAMVATSLTVASSGFVRARTDSDWSAALSAAYGGLEEYQSRLAADSTYVQYGNPSAVFSAGSSATLSLPPATASNPAFGIGASGTWAAIPGSGGAASYRYEVDNSDYAASGLLHLRVTGRAGEQTRSVVADLKQTGFLDFLYFTDYEVFDPIFSGESASCAQYAWAGRPAGCATIQFGAMDVINGPLHSNDQLVICGTRFNGAVSTASTLTPFFTTPSGCSAPVFAAGGGVTYSSSIGMPPTNSELKKETRTDLGDVPRPGCLYTGPTSITFNGNGTMTVVSPWTRFTQVSETSGTNSGSCGQPGTGSGQLGDPGGATIPVLSSNLAYVQNVPGVGSADPNAPVSAAPPAGFACTGTSAFPGWTFGSTSYPRAGEAQPDGTGASNPAYKCTNGDVFVKGTMSGAMTVAAENFVYVTGDLVYANAQTSILGLVGNNAVQVWNPRTPTGLVNTSSNRTIDAAILSVAHTFTVQNYKRGPARGTLTVLGAIAQKFRGPVATTSGGSIQSGYAKNYIYDQRLRSTAPPKFLTPTSTTYGVTQVAEVPDAFTAKGVAG